MQQQHVQFGAEYTVQCVHDPHVASIKLLRSPHCERSVETISSRCKLGIFCDRWMPLPIWICQCVWWLSHLSHVFQLISPQIGHGIVNSWSALGIEPWRSKKNSPWWAPYCGCCRQEVPMQRSWQSHAIPVMYLFHWSVDVTLIKREITFPPISFQRKRSSGDKCTIYCLFRQWQVLLLRFGWWREGNLHDKLLHASQCFHNSLPVAFNSKRTTARFNDGLYGNHAY